MARRRNRLGAEAVLRDHLICPNALGPRADARELWARVERQAQAALAAGALRQIETTAIQLDDGGIPFVVRRAIHPRPREAGAKPERADPFAPPEAELLVQDLSRTHFALINKHNVLDRHLLAVTHADIDQRTLLDAADFEAFALCMGEEPVLGFYNGGAEAGASQRHKHLQVVRLPLAPEGEAIPLQRVIDASALEGLPYRTAFARLERNTDTPVRARALHETYRALLQDAGIDAVPSADGDRQSRPYNLLVTHDWMLLVPRTTAEFEGIGLNSLAFAGTIFVRGEAQLATLRRIGPMAVLCGVAEPRG